MNVKVDYPVEIFHLIYKNVPYSEFPLKGCWQLSNNSRKAIERLNYHKCPLHAPPIILPANPHCGICSSWITLSLNATSEVLYGEKTWL
jgi:hypothetical protein